MYFCTIVIEKRYVTDAMFDVAIKKKFCNNSEKFVECDASLVHMCNT